jgi:hypothetical protein
MEQQGERVEVVVDAATARYLRSRASSRGGSMAEAAARQLHELAVADGVAKLVAWSEDEPEFGEHAEAERIEAGIA